jgi:hypothetical protein
MDQQELIAHDDRTGLDLPDADGQVSDEDVDRLDGKKTGKGGQDHSLDTYAENSPTSGVRSVQESSDTSSDIAHFDE